MLKDNGLTLTCYGVITPGNEQEWRKVFDFAKDMGFETIVSEPAEKDLRDDRQAVQRVQDRRRDPQPSRSPPTYWNYETVLKACEGRSKMDRLLCGYRALDPLGDRPARGDQGLGQGRPHPQPALQGPQQIRRRCPRCPLGQRREQAREILAELAAEKFEGPFSIEYEYNWDNSVPEITKCVEWFKKTAAELSDVPAKDVFQKDLSNAVMPPHGWAFDADGVLTPGSAGHGDIWTKERYGNFTLELDFKVPEKGNSGVFIRTGDIENWINTAIEVQIHATTDGTKFGQCGAIYDCLPPSKDATKKPGEWNHYVITCLDNKIYVNLNGAGHHRHGPEPVDRSRQEPRWDQEQVQDGLQGHAA